MTELDAAERFLATRLAARAELMALLGSGIRIFAAASVPGAALPHVIFDVLPAPDSRTQDHRSMVSLSAPVRAVGESFDSTALHLIAEQIDLALHNARGVSDGYEIIVLRESMYRLDQPDQGELLNEVGGVYDVIVRPA